MTFEEAWEVVKSSPNYRMYPKKDAWEYLMQAYDASPENNPDLDRGTSTGVHMGRLHHVASNDANHYFVRTNFDGLANWAIPQGLSIKVLKIPHEDFDRIDNDDHPYDEIIPNKKKPWRTKSVPRTYNTGIAIENWHPHDEDESKPFEVFRQRMKDAIEQAFVERDIDADPAAFGYDE